MKDLRCRGWRSGCAILLVIVGACTAPGPKSRGPEVLPEIKAFLKAHPEYGTVRGTTAMPDWAKGARQQINLTSGNHLFYVQDGQVVTVYKYEGEGRREVYRKDLSEPVKNGAARPAENETPAYKVLDSVNLMAGGRYGDILVASFSRQTPVAERESALRAIMAKERFSRAALYCSEEAMKANTSSSFAASHPNALKTCFLGSIGNGKFTPGEALF